MPCLAVWMEFRRDNGQITHPTIMLVLWCNDPYTLQKKGFHKAPMCPHRARVSNSSAGGPLCLLVSGLFSAPLVHSTHWLAKEWTHLGMQALIDSWLKGNHKNLQTLWPPGNWVWHPWTNRTNNILRLIIDAFVICHANSQNRCGTLALLMYPLMKCIKNDNICKWFLCYSLLLFFLLFQVWWFHFPCISN